MLQLNIHRFKVIARFGLMHVVATNICVWIRTLVYESIKEITQYHRRRDIEDAGILANIRHSLRNPAIPGLDRDLGDINKFSGTTNRYSNKVGRTVPTTLAPSFGKLSRTTARSVARAATLQPDISSSGLSSVPSTMFNDGSSSNPGSTISSTLSDYLSTFVTSKNSDPAMASLSTSSSAAVTSVGGDLSTAFVDPSNSYDTLQADAKLNATGILGSTSQLFNPGLNAIAEALSATDKSLLPTNSCGRVNIMGTIVQDAAPYLYPFIIEYSLIGAAVIYVMWKHIGRYPRWPHQAEADLERRLEAMLSRRAVALAQAGEHFFYLLNELNIT